jgi:hypothetical protein
MIDTIKVGQIISPKEYKELLERKVWEQTFDPETGKPIGLKYKEKGKENPYLSAFTAPDNISYLSAKVSLPSLYSRSNVNLLTQKQVYESLDLLSRYVSNKSGLKFNAGKANVWQVHFTDYLQFNQVSVKPILKQIAEMTIPYFQSGLYRNFTVYFQSGKARTICIYDKHLESKNNKFSSEDIKYAKGKIRIEYRFNTTKSVKQLSEKEMLSNRKAYTILSHTLSKKLLTPIKEQILTLVAFKNTQEKIQILTKRYGSQRTSTLIAHLVRQEIFGHKYFEEESLRINKTSYYRARKACQNVGVYSLSESLIKTDESK